MRDSKIKVAMMQPYFLPYIGYWQLINSADKFIICDNIQYTKRGWFNKNRILDNGSDLAFTIPLKKEKHRVDVNQRFLASNVHDEITRILKQISCLYAKAPYFEKNYPLIKKLFEHDEENLFDYIYYSVTEICSLLNIQTKLIICSSINMNHDLKGQERVIETCKNVNANIYINPIGGLELYNKDEFKEHDIELRFLKSKYIEYQQFNHHFVPWLSIIDVLMFNDLATIKDYLKEYELE